MIFLLLRFNLLCEPTVTSIRHAAFLLCCLAILLFSAVPTFAADDGQGLTLQQNGFEYTQGAATVKASGAEDRSKASLERDTGDSYFHLGGGYDFESEAFEVETGYSWLFDRKTSAALIDATFGGELFQFSGSYGNILDFEPGDGTSDGVIRATYSFLDKRKKVKSKQVDSSGVKWVAQHTLGIEYDRFDDLGFIPEGINNELKTLYRFHYVPDTSLTYLGQVETNTVNAWQRDNVYAMFRSGALHVAKVEDDWGTERFKITLGAGVEYAQYDKINTLELSRENKTSLAGDAGVRINLMPWLQVGGEAKYSSIQSVYRADITGDVGPGLLKASFEKAENHDSDDEKRVYVGFDLPVAHLDDFLGGIFSFDGKQIQRGLGECSTSDDLVLFAHRNNPEQFTSARLDARHVTGATDKFLQAGQIGERNRLDILISKNGLAANVTTNGSIITVNATPVLTGINSVNPAAEAPAFSIVGGDLRLDTSLLSQTTQSILVDVAEAGGGNTVIQIDVVHGSTKITGVDFASGLTSAQATAFMAGTMTLAQCKAAACSGGPVVETPIADRSEDENTAINFDISGNFSHPESKTITFSQTGLPAGLSLNANTGVISGTTPEVADTTTYTVVITATDPDGKTCEDTFDINVRNVAVVLGRPTLTLNAASDTGISNSDKYTKDTTPTFSWTSVTGATAYEFSWDGGTNWSNVGNNTNYTTPGLADGVHSVRVRALNADGAGPQSTDVAITIDTQPFAAQAYDKTEITKNVATVVTGTFTGGNGGNVYRVKSINVLSGAATITGSADGSGNTVPFNVLVTAANAFDQCEFEFVVEDQAGNEYAGNGALDVSNGPTVNSFDIRDSDGDAEAGYSSNLLVALSITGSPDVAGWWVSEDPTRPAPDAIGWLAVNPTQVGLSDSDGLHTLYVYAKDAAGNVSTNYRSDTIILDRAAPTVNSFNMTDSDGEAVAGYTSSRTVDLAITESANAIGWYITTSAVAPATDAIGWTAKPTAFTLPDSDGSYTYYCYVKSAAGLVSASASDTIILDRAAPTVNSFSMTDSDGEAMAGYTSSQTVDLAITESANAIGWYITTSAVAPATDAIGWTAIRPTSFTLPDSDGSYTYYCYVKSAAGLVSASASDTIILDRAAPYSLSWISGVTTRNTAYTDRVLQINEPIMSISGVISLGNGSISNVRSTPGSANVTFDYTTPDINEDFVLVEGKDRAGNNFSKMVSSGNL